MPRNFTSSLTVLLAILLASAVPALGQEPPERESASQEQSPGYAQEAQKIRDLMAGKLDPAVDVAELLSLSLTSRNAPRARAVAKLLTDASLYSRVRNDLSLLAPLPEDEAGFALAQATFLRMPQSQRERLLDAHQERFDALREKRENKEAEQAQVAKLRRELQGLEDFLQGKPASSAVLSVDLLDDRTGHFNSAQLDALTVDMEEIGAEPSPDDPIRQQLDWLRGQVSRAKAKLIKLPADRLAQLEVSSGITSGSADDIASADAELDTARSQLSEAAQAARNAVSEQERLVASERAQLFRSKSIQAEFRVRLARSKSEPDTIRESALSWRHKIQDLSRTGERNEQQVDAIFAELVSELGQVRERLRIALNRSETVPVQGLDPRPLDPALLEDSKETKELLEQKASLLREAEQLRGLYREQSWAERRALRDAMVLLNGERLGLIPLLSRAKRTGVVGFGNDGVAQVQREISEIFLELRFFVQSWRQTLMSLAQPILHPTPGFVVAMLRLILIALAFSWWRQHGDPFLQRAQFAAEARRPRTLSSTLRAGILEYWRRVRRPLDWLILTVLIWWLWPQGLDIPGISFVWIILFWSLITILIVNLVDELARGRGRDDPRAKLRWNSLRLIAGSLLAVGLLLNLTRASVGKGAIYNWVFTLSWLLIPAILIILANWWRRRIVVLSTAEAEGSVLLTWVSRDPDGLTGLFGRMTAGALLLLKGVRSIIARRMRDLALVRELFEQRARAQAARQVAEDKASGRFHRPAPEVLESLDPHRTPAELRIGADRPGGVDLPELPPGTVTLIVGERGLGKTAFLHDLAMRLGEDAKIISLRVDARGFEGVLADLSDSLESGPASADPGALSENLAASAGPVLVTIDDIQRMILPAIGGLASVDALIAMARDSGSTCRWAFTIGDGAWSYLQRARVDRVLFDTIIRLPHWSASEVRALIERRSVQAGIEPDFSAMIDEGIFELGEELTVEERKRRGYFDRLTEYVNGNPAIALEYWRRSLFVDGEDQKMVVRTFDTPAVARLSALPLPALFVLRAIHQMDITNVPAIQQSTDLSISIVTDALRSLKRLGAVISVDGSYRIALHWWIEVTRLLQRQNLIVRGMK